MVVVNLPDAWRAVGTVVLRKFLEVVVVVVGTDSVVVGTRLLWLVNGGKVVEILKFSVVSFG